MVDSLIGLVRDAVALIRNRIEYEEQIKHFLMVCIEENGMLGQDWVPSSSLRLDTEAVFIPLRLIGDDRRPEDLVSVLKAHDRIVLQGQPGAGKYYNRS